MAPCIWQTNCRIWWWCWWRWWVKQRKPYPIKRSPRQLEKGESQKRWQRQGHRKTLRQRKWILSEIINQWFQSCTQWDMWVNCGDKSYKTRWLPFMATWVSTPNSPPRSIILTIDKSSVIETLMPYKSGWYSLSSCLAQQNEIYINIYIHTTQLSSSQ